MALRSSLWLYPWDVVDEGAAQALDRARELAGVDAVNLAVSYHAGWLLLPHNPRRHLYAAEDGVLYFRGDARLFGEDLQPGYSALLDDTDPLGETLMAAAQADLAVRAWAVCCHNARLASACPELAVRNAFDDPLPFALCPLQPRVQRYLEGMVQALGAYAALEAIELESLYWQPPHHAWHHPKFGMPLDAQSLLLLGMCCCRACTAFAEVDGDVLRAALREPLEVALQGGPHGPLTRESVAALGPSVAALLEAREAGLTALLRRLVAVAHVPVRVLIGSTLAREPWTCGLDLRRWAAIASQITVNAYSRTSAEVADTLSGVRSMAPEAALVVGLDATSPNTSDAAGLTQQALATVPSHPIELSYYNYGLLPLERLDWVRQATRSARTAGDEPVLRG